MEQYKDIFFASSIIVALWIVALGSNPQMPHIPEFMAMIAASLYLVYTAVKMHRLKKRFMSLSFIISALMPFVFYVELYYINTQALNIDQDVFAANMQHVFVIYNIFRFIALFLSFACALKLLFIAIKDFGSL